MSTHTKFLSLAAGLTLMAAPAAVAAPAADAPAKTNGPAWKAPCNGLSKTHVDGEKGTAYSRCVSAAAKAKNDAKPATPATPAATKPAKAKTPSWKAACKGLSKKHVKGEKGTPYSRCVTAAAKKRNAEKKAAKAAAKAAAATPAPAAS